MFNAVVLSTNLDRTFFDFLPVTYVAWRKWFDITPMCAVIDKDNIGDSIRHQLINLGIWPYLTHVEPIAGIPQANYSKFARLSLASILNDRHAIAHTDTVCTIHDMDSIPLQSAYAKGIMSGYESGKLLAVGHEVYNNGKFPMSFVTGTPSTFKRAINPDNMPFKTLVRSCIGTRIHDDKEDISNAPDQFSDESLLRALMTRNNFQDVVKQPRNVNVRHDWIDRSWWNELNVDKLRAGGYTECNFLRPLHQHIDQIMPVLEYVCDGTEFTPNDLILKY